jgi:hypothetical protein
MSYDLYFNRTDPLTPKEIDGFFKDRKHYTLSTGQAVYENADTGVYFLFDLKSSDEESESQGIASFNLNYFRPHFFGLEAAPEVDAVVRHFGFSISDPQNEGMGDGPFTPEGFVNGWNAGNAFGYRAILKSENAPKVVYSRPRSELESTWRWNLERERIQSTLGDDVFVPRISWVMLGGAVASAVVWPDAIPTLIPAVDLLIIPRDELAPRGFFSKASKKDTCYIPYEQAVNCLAPPTPNKYSLPAHIPTGKTATPDARSFVKRLTPNLQKPQFIAADSVLNAELVDASRS